MSSDSRRRLGAITALVAGLFVGLTLLPLPVTGPIGHSLGQSLWRVLGAGALGIPLLGIGLALAGFERLGALDMKRSAFLIVGLSVLLPYLAGVLGHVTVADLDTQRFLGRMVGVVPGFFAVEIPLGIGPAGAVLIGFLVLSALTLALPGKGAEVRLFLHEPLVRAWLVLLALTLLHLLGDAPTHGLYGIRDASFVVEGLFLLLGFLCATGERRPPDAAEAHGSAAWPEFSVCVYPPTGRITAGCVAGLGGFSPGSTAGFLSPDVPISREWRRPARSGRQGHARMAVVATTAQPWLEFSYGTIPFYILLGYGVGLAGHVDAVADRAEASLRP